jgi:hypothetical protein
MIRYKIDIDEIVDNNADVGGDDFDPDEDFILSNLCRSTSFISFYHKNNYHKNYFHYNQKFLEAL